MNILVRGLSRKMHAKIQKLAKEEDLSVNQEVMRMLNIAIEKKEIQSMKRKKNSEAFKRLMELREELYKKYGMFEDSTHLIREDRDSR